MIENIEHTLQHNFESITLKEMDNVKLMDRMDSKFTFHISQLSEILNDVSKSYKVLNVSGKRISKYETLYYDTDNFQLYLQHHNGKLNRYKIRHRTYVESNLGFLEVKFKNNKGRTIKERIKKKEVQNVWDTQSTEFLNSTFPYSHQQLIPALWVNYKRITLVSKFLQERVTLDIEMKFKNTTKEFDLSALVIAEVKQDNKQISDFASVMKRRRIREGSLSKYCMAVAFLNDDIRKNSFKFKLNQVHKILNHDTASNN